MAEKINGDYPNGFLNIDDEGSVKMTLSEENGNLRVDFSDTVKWFALPPDAAAQLGLALIRNAKKIGLTKPLQIIL